MFEPIFYILYIYLLFSHKLFITFLYYFVIFPQLFYLFRVFIFLRFVRFYVECCLLLKFQCLYGNWWRYFDGVWCDCVDFESGGRNVGVIRFVGEWESK